MVKQVRLERPSNYLFKGLEWRDKPEDVPAIPELRENIGPAVDALRKCLHWITFSSLSTTAC